MKRRRMALGLLVPAVLAACTPALNWREIRFDDAPLVGLLPCKPDQGARGLTIDGAPITLSMKGCEADGHLFTLAYAQLPDSVDPVQALAAWKRAMLANVGAPASRDTRFVPPGATPLDGSVLARYEGQANGSALVGQSAFFVQGRRIYQAAIYSPHPDGSAADTFFSGLRIE